MDQGQRRPVTNCAEPTLLRVRAAQCKRENDNDEDMGHPGIALVASTSPTLAQDAAAGEQIFKRLCSPCHDIGPDGPSMPLSGGPSLILARKTGTFEGFNYSPVNKSSGINLKRGDLPQIYPSADARDAGHPHGIFRRSRPHSDKHGRVKPSTAAARVPSRSRRTALECV
jgi:hypothetical protein